MKIRDKFLKAMRRESEGYIPKSIGLCSAQLERFEKEYGHRDYACEWKLPVKGVHLPFRPTTDDFTKWLGVLNERTTVDEWGIGHERATNGSHFEHYLHPLENICSGEEVRNYPFPLPASTEDVDRCKETIKHIRQAGFVSQVSVAPVGGTVFWPSYKLRGMENLLCDLSTNPDLVRCLLDKVTNLCIQQAHLASSTRPDILHLADDLGTQISSYVSPKTFRTWFKPRLAEIIHEAKETHPEVLVSFHSDGAIQDFIPDLIEIGVDILNPVQPECMDPVEIKRRYGDRLSFWGCLGTQTTLPFGTSEEVGNKTKFYCEEMGKGGGFWIAPTHLVEPEVPWENVLAFIKTADEYAQLF
ncbi:MAG: uroporphyrinogen decarboxylase family protein [Verrucomicrobiae bacterium]|nr:uroporphyrinogen decarboxylase family protein [Verrucomicrobiae bacterium]